MAMQAMEQMSPDEAVVNGVEWKMLSDMEMEEEEVKGPQPKHMRQGESEKTQPQHLRQEEDEASNRRPNHLREPKHLRWEDEEMGDFQPQHLRQEEDEASNRRPNHLREPKHLRWEDEEMGDFQPQHLRTPRHLREDEGEVGMNSPQHLREEKEVVLDRGRMGEQPEGKIRQELTRNVGEGDSGEDETSAKGEILAEDGVKKEGTEEPVLVDEEGGIGEAELKRGEDETIGEFKKSEIEEGVETGDGLGGDATVGEQVEDERAEEEPGKGGTGNMIVEYRSKGADGGQIVLSEGKKDEHGKLAMPDRMMVLDRAEVDEMMEEFTLIRGFIGELAADTVKRMMGRVAVKMTPDEISDGFQKYIERYGKGGMEVDDNVRETLQREYLAEVPEETRKAENRRASRGIMKTEEELGQEAKKEEMREITRTRESLQKFAAGRGINLDFRMAGELIDGFTPEMQKKEESKPETTTGLSLQERADFIKYAEAHGIKGEAEMSGWSQERLQAFGRDFEAWRKLKSGRMRALVKVERGQLQTSGKRYDDHIKNSEDVIARIKNHRAYKAQVEMQDAEKKVARVQRVRAENEQQQAHIDVTMDRLQRRLKRARARYEREDARRGKGLTSEEKARIEHEEREIERYKEGNRLADTEKAALEAGVDGDKVRYSVGQKQVMDESALLTKMKQEYRTIPVWKVGERRKMKRRIEKQREVVKQAVESLTEAQKGRLGERSWVKGETNSEGGETQNT